MDIVITEWGFQSYLDLKHSNVFTRDDYKNTIRPDVELLKAGFPSPHAKMANAKFWSQTTDRSGVRLDDGYKMKWHNMGPGNVQLRLLVALLNNKAYLCDAYVKTSDKLDKRMVAKLKMRIRDISQGTFVQRGLL